MITKDTKTSEKPDDKKNNPVSRKETNDFSYERYSPDGHASFLQGTIGNRAVHRLFKSGILQPKLRIGKRGDKYEQEADRIAEQVMRMPDPDIKYPTKEEEHTIQPKRTPGQNSDSSPDTESSIDFLRGSGHPLPESVRDFFESCFRYDFSNIRVHTDSKASDMNRKLNARSFTYGRDVYFGDGFYQPGETHGQRLLAHELTHVIQQRQSAVPALQRQQDVTEPTAGTSVNNDETSNTAVRSGPPVLFGLDTTTRRIYVSVTTPGRSLVEIATYIYGTADKAAELQARNGVPDMVPAGRNLTLVEGQYTEFAHRAVNNALRQGTILRTEGVPSSDAGDGRVLIYRFSAAGQTYELTEGQFQGMMRGLNVYLTRKTNYFRGLLEGELEVRDDHVENTNSVIRGISDWMGDVEVPERSIWTGSISRANDLIDNLARGELAASQITRDAERLSQIAAGYDRAHRAWRIYIEGTISGAESTAAGLEIVRDTSFVIAAGLAGAAAAPVVLGATGAGLATAGVTGTTATVLSGTAAIGGGALAGGTLRGGLEVIAPGMQAEVPASERFVHGFGRGAVAGGIGAAGALAAPGVSGAISQRLFGTAPQALTGAGARAAVGALTGLTIGVPSGLLDAAIINAPAFARGEITAGQYLEMIGWGAAAGAAFGTIIGALGGALARPRPTTTELAPTRPSTGRGVSPDFVVDPPQVNRATGEITQIARHLQSGEAVQLRFNPGTGEASMVRMSTGEVFPVRLPTGRMLPAPSGAGRSGGSIVQVGSQPEIVPSGGNLPGRPLALPGSSPSATQPAVDLAVAGAQIRPPAHLPRYMQRDLMRNPPAMDPDRSARMREIIRRYRLHPDVPRRIDEPGTPGVRVEGGTVAIVQTDIPTLHGRNFPGASRRALPPEMRGRPGTTGGDVMVPTHPTAIDHGEHVALENLRAAIDEALERGVIQRSDLQGRIVHVMVEQEPCSSCVSGPIRQFSARYPELTIEVRNMRTSRAYIHTGGRLLNP